MKSSDEIKKGLEKEIPVHYHLPNPEPRLHPTEFMELKNLHASALSYITRLEQRPAQERFEVLDELSCAFYGKKMYGLNDDGTVYSRYSCDNMSFEEAVSELSDLLCEDEEVIERLTTQLTKAEHERDVAYELLGRFRDGNSYV